MTSRKHQEISAQPSEVSKFYNGKSIFITGSAGFLGSVLLEILLRCCPDIHKVYILIRPKRGVMPEERKEEIFKKDIFRKLKEKNPDVLDKVIVVPGDIAYKNLGINDNDLQKLIEDVSIVFHVAASISFLRPLSYMLQYNTVSTNSVIELCRKLKNLDVLVHTSTAYSCSNQEYEIDEIIYKNQFTAQDVLSLTEKGREEDLMAQYSNCDPKFQNFYTYSKNIAENLLQEKASDLPVVIVRPSLILYCWKGILPGYVEENSGFGSLGLGIGKGFLRVIRIDTELLVDIIPVDIVANTHIVAAWIQVKERLPSPCIYNCTSNETIPYTFGDLYRIMVDTIIKNPLPKTFQKPSVIFCKSPIKYWILSILEHYAPAIVIDAFLWLSGRKFRLFKLYTFLEKILASTQNFLLREWFLRSKNFRGLSEKINSTDAELFSVDLKDFRLETTFSSIITGAPIYKGYNEKKSYAEHLRSTVVYYCLSSFIKLSLLGSFAYLTYVAIF